MKVETVPWYGVVRAGEPDCSICQVAAAYVDCRGKGDVIIATVDVYEANSYINRCHQGKSVYTCVAILWE